VVSRRFVKKQQMRWTEAGAHLLLQIRTQVLDQTWRGTLSRWYPGMNATPQLQAA
jgi:general stress protein 26